MINHLRIIRLLDEVAKGVSRSDDLRIIGGERYPLVFMGCIKDFRKSIPASAIKCFSFCGMSTL